MMSAAPTMRSLEHQQPPASAQFPQSKFTEYVVLCNKVAKGSLRSALYCYFPAMGRQLAERLCGRCVSLSLKVMEQPRHTCLQLSPPAAGTAGATGRAPRRTLVRAESEQHTRPGPQPSQRAHAAEDPFALVSDELGAVGQRMLGAVKAEIPSLSTAAEYFFRSGSEGKRVRPTALLLLASALSGRGPAAEHTAVDHSPSGSTPSNSRRKHQRLAEVTELMHVASLLHDDVIDGAEIRRGNPSLNRVAGNKLAILAGDFLLARASMTLASLEHTEVIRLLSRVLEHLVGGEAMQMSASESDLSSFDYYYRKTYLKTASMLASSSRAIALLGGHPQEVAESAEGFGKHLGLTLQVVDDVLDFTSSSTTLGKPALSDLQQGIATAPVLFAAEEKPSLNERIKRRFRAPGDVEATNKAVNQTDGIERAKGLASEHAESALEYLQALPKPESQFGSKCASGLEALTLHVLRRC